MRRGNEEKQREEARRDENKEREGDIQKEGIGRAIEKGGRKKRKRIRARQDN